MFNIEKAHFIVDEMVMSGYIVETNKTNILNPVVTVVKAGQQAGAGKWCSSLYIIIAENFFIKLNTETPLITVSATRLTQFEVLFNKYNFELYEEYNSYYRNHLSEFSFNSGIEDTNSVTLHENFDFNREESCIKNLINAK